jgi:hypothetical protein
MRFPHGEPLPLPLTKLRRQHPFQVLFCLACVVVGLILAASDTKPQSIAAAMPGFVQGAWQVLLVVGGSVGLTAAFWRGNLATALAVELGALIALGAALSMYCIALFAVAGLAAVASGTFVGTFGAACWWRTTQITRSVRAYIRRHDRRYPPDL